MEEEEPGGHFGIVIWVVLIFKLLIQPNIEIGKSDNLSKDLVI